MSDDIRADEQEQTASTLEGVAVRIFSWRIDGRYAARVETVDPGDSIGRGRGGSREEACAAAIAGAALRLGLTAARQALASSMKQLHSKADDEK